MSASKDARRGGVPPGTDAYPLWGKDLRYDDIGNADRFASVHGANVRWVHAWAKWIVWDGQRWRVDPQGVMVLELAKDVPAEMYRQLASNPVGDGAQALSSGARRLSSKGPLQAMVDLARGMDGIRISHDELDADQWALGVANGWVDLREGTFHGPDPTKLMTMGAAAEWQADAHAPQWEKALAEWMPDPEVRDYFQRLCGASVVGQIKDHMLVVVYGPGGNGKGTALGAISRALGDYYTVPHKSLLVTQKHESHDTVKASLFRTRMAVAAESDMRVRLNEASIKELTGGDPLRARRMYENEWAFIPSHTLWLQTNYLPEVSGTDRGIWRRIKVLPWTATFVGAGEDRDLSMKLEEEMPGILRWLVEGVARWQEVGLGDDTVPAAVASATDDYQRAEDVVGRWIKDRGLALDPDAETDAVDLVASWKQWTEMEFGRDRRFNDVSAWLEAHDCHKKVVRRAVGAARRQTTIWRGIGWASSNGRQPGDADPYETEIF